MTFFTTFLIWVKSGLSGDKQFQRTKKKSHKSLRSEEWRQEIKGSRWDLQCFHPVNFLLLKRENFMMSYHIKVYEGTIYIVDIVAISKYMRVQ